MEVLLATCDRLPRGEPGAAALDAALAARGVTARWACWDDASVDWAATDLVAVRSTWDYADRLDEFLAWAAEVGPRLLHGPAVFAWNTHKGYVVELGDAGVPIVPTEVVATADDVQALLAGGGSWVVKPAVGAGGRGVALVSDADDSAWSPDAPGPWIVQPYAPSVVEEGEVSVFVIDGEPVAQVAKRPAAGEIRVHETYGGTSVPVPLTAEATEAALTAYAAAQRVVGVELVYARVDLLRVAGDLRVSEVELTEPGLYLDVMPENADRFADAVARRVGLSSSP